MAITKIPAAGFTGNNFRNIIINGDMSIAQRGTSTSGVTGSGYFTCDRWNLQATNVGTWTQTQETDVPSGQGFAKSFKMDCTTANASLGVAAYLKVRHKIEGQNLQYIKKGTSSAESLTLSFWVKSNKTGTYIVEFEDRDNNRHISQSYTINTANTWEKKILTYDGDTSGALDNDNTDAINIAWYLATGSNNTSGTLATSWQNIVTADRAVGQVNLADSTANEWYITGVQLEAGTTASDFEFLPYDVNLTRCQRYCYAYANYGAGPTSGNYMLSARYATSGSHTTIVYPTQMRIEPSITYGTGGGGVVDTDYSTPSNLQFYDADDAGWYIYDVLAEAEL
jgi:phage gp37-like protein